MKKNLQIAAIRIYDSSSKKLHSLTKLKSWYFIIKKSLHTSVHPFNFQYKKRYLGITSHHDFNCSACLVSLSNAFTWSNNLMIFKNSCLILWGILEIFPCVLEIKICLVCPCVASSSEVVVDVAISGPCQRGPLLASNMDESNRPVFGSTKITDLCLYEAKFLVIAHRKRPTLCS